MPTKWPNKPFDNTCTELFDGDPNPVSEAIRAAGVKGFDPEKTKWDDLVPRLKAAGCSLDELPLLTINRIYQLMLQCREPILRTIGAMNTNRPETTYWPLGNPYIPKNMPGAGKAADKSPPDKLSPARHTEDFRGVHWYGKDYDFTPTQARIVEILWEVWEQRLPAVGDDYVLEKAEVTKSRLADIFRGNSAWGTMIRVGGTEGTTKGTRRLFPPKT